MDYSFLPSGDFIAGLTDGEGCFVLKFRRDFKKNRTNAPAYFGWQAAFVIVLRKDDMHLLEKVRKVIGCGTISYSGNSVRLQVQDTKELINKIVPFFRKYRLYGKKADDFKLWLEAVSLIAKNKRQTVNVQRGVRGFTRVIWKTEDLVRLNEIRNLMLPYKAAHPPFKWDKSSVGE